MTHRGRSGAMSAYRRPPRLEASRDKRAMDAHRRGDDPITVQSPGNHAGVAEDRLATYRVLIWRPTPHDASYDHPPPCVLMDGERISATIRLRMLSLGSWRRRTAAYECKPSRLVRGVHRSVLNWPERRRPCDDARWCRRSLQPFRWSAGHSGWRGDTGAPTVTIVPAWCEGVLAVMFGPGVLSRRCRDERPRSHHGLARLARPRT